MNMWANWVAVKKREDDHEIVHLMLKETADLYFKDAENPTDEEFFIYRMSVDLVTEQNAIDMPASWFMKIFQGENDND